MSILKGEAALARKLHAQKETTGRIINHPPSEAYAEGWDRVFGKTKERADEESCPKCGADAFREGPMWTCPSCMPEALLTWPVTFRR